MTASIAIHLADLVGADAVLDAELLPDYAIGSFLPAAAVRPPDASGIAAVIACARRAGLAVYPAGGRTFAPMGNRPTRPGIALDLTALNKLTDLQPADLTVSVQAGMTLAQLDAALAPHGKFVPLGAPLPRQATVGGTLAAGVSGLLRAAYGLPRDWLIGVAVAGADGVITKAGGKVVKNVTGYDLNRLYAGSLGSLAVITAATFKLAPAPPEWAVIAAAFTGIDEAVAAVRDLQNRPYAPLSLHILNPAAARHTAARHTNRDSLPAGYGPVAVAIIGGRSASLQRRLADTSVLWLDTAAALHVARDDAPDLIAALNDLPAAPDHPPTICVRVNAPPAALPDLMALGQARADGLWDDALSPPAIIADAGFGGGRLLWWDDFTAVDPARLAGQLRKVQDIACSLGGDAIVERCPESAKPYLDVWGTEPSAMSVMRRLKYQFDPDNILNPGRFIGGL